jgi:hypothetical protein
VEGIDAAAENEIREKREKGLDDRSVRLLIKLDRPRLLTLVHHTPSPSAATLSQICASANTRPVIQQSFRVPDCPSLRRNRNPVV